MIHFFTLITLLMGLSMFFISRDKKIALMFIGCMNLTLLRTNIPIISDARSVLTFCFLISEIKNVKVIISRLNQRPIGYVFLLVILSVILSIIFSIHLHSFNEARIFLQRELFLTYFALGYSFFSIRNVFLANMQNLRESQI